MDDLPLAAPKTASLEADALCPYELVDRDGDPGFLVICDHASNALPPDYGTLGLPASEFSRHIAFDIGAVGVARALARLLGAPAVLARFDDRDRSGIVHGRNSSVRHALAIDRRPFAIARVCR